MRSRSVWGLVLGLGLLAALGSPGRAEGVQWGTSFPSAVQAAKKSGKLVMVDFYTDWCGYCKKLDAEVFTDRQFVQLAGQLVPVKINPERDEAGVAVAQQYGVRSFPTILFFNGDNELVGRIGGYLPAPEFIGYVQSALKTEAGVRQKLARLQAGQADAATAADLVRVYTQRRNESRSLAALARLEQVDPKNASGKLSMAYGMMGNLYTVQQKPDRALPYFDKATRAAKKPEDRVMGNVGAAICYLAQNQKKPAQARLRAALAVPNCPPELKARVREMLGAVQKM